MRDPDLLLELILGARDTATRSRAADPASMGA